MSAANSIQKAVVMHCKNAGHFRQQISLSAPNIGLASIFQDAVSIDPLFIITSHLRNLDVTLSL